MRVLRRGQEKQTSTLTNPPNMIDIFVFGVTLGLCMERGSFHSGCLEWIQCDQSCFLFRILDQICCADDVPATPGRVEVRCKATGLNTCYQTQWASWWGSSSYSSAWLQDQCSEVSALLVWSNFDPVLVSFLVKGTSKYTFNLCGPTDPRDKNFNE